MCVLSCFITNAQSWVADSICENYECTEVNFTDDYSGKVKCTVTRRLTYGNRQVAVLYIHGYNDYFFQTELGDRFVNNGYNFYAVDLRKYGRSILHGQRLFEVRDLSEYFEDINAALDIIVHDGNCSIIIMGHSTGGLIASYYMAKANWVRYPVKALVLSSPFLDMNLGTVTEDFLLPFVCLCGKWFPDIELDQGCDNMYARTLLKKYVGEWSYNTAWKTEMSRPVTLGWLRAITSAQDFLHKGVEVGVPILLMHSDYSSNGTDEELAHITDIVLNVDEISRYGKRLGNDVTEYIVKNGIHDLFLSRMPIRYALYSHLFQWLESKGL